MQLKRWEGGSLSQLPAFLLNQIAIKLMCEGVNKSNYSFDCCVNILSKCVMPNKLIAVFKSNQIQILNQIK
jgi:hypothetical protein